MKFDYCVSSNAHKIKFVIKKRKIFLLFELSKWLYVCVCERKFQIHDGEEFNSRNNRTRSNTIPSDLTNDVHDENETESTRATKAAASKNNSQRDQKR